MAKFFLRFGIVLLVLVVTVITTLLIVKWVDSDRLAAEKIQLTAEVQQLQSIIDEAPEDTLSEIVTLRHRDAGMDVTIDFPSDWDIENNIEVSGYGENIDGTDDDLFGPIMTTYQTEFSKSGVKLTFSKILGGVGGMSQFIDENQSDVVVVKDGTLARYKDKNGSQWSYVQILTAPDACEAAEAVTNGTICFAAFFPGFGTSKYASLAKVVGIDAAILAEADQIAISALRD
jgi:hypothetical protein